jgi:sialic acid synthase SpsE
MRTAAFEDLFVLELASNHWGKLDRGLKIVNDYARVVHSTGVRAALKLQFRDVDTFIHKDFREGSDLRYVNKTLATKMPWANYRFLVEATRHAGMVTMATPFDEFSVDKCVELGVEIIKIASSDLQDWFLIEKVAATGKPVMISTGGSSLSDMDDVVAYFEKKNIPLGINHCVSLYPSEDNELELNQVDFLVNRYPDNVIGLSTHEYHDWRSSLIIAYAKGARTFERHIDVDYEGVPVSAYCSLPHQAEEWFQAFQTAKKMCGAPGIAKRAPPAKELQYLAGLVRGVYAKRDLPAGHILSDDDFYLAIPLQKGQISSHELKRGEVLVNPLKADDVISFGDVAGAAKADTAVEKRLDVKPAEIKRPARRVA